MKKQFALILCVLFALSVLPGAFADQPVVNVYNWADYIDEDVLAVFEEETGIKVNYMYFTTNEDMYPQVCVAHGAYDVVIPSDYFVERLINSNMLAPINFDNVPNSEYTLANLRNMDYDPENLYSIPYMWGTLGILYNTTMVDEADVQSWDILFSSKYAGQIIMLDSIRDTMGIALKYVGSLKGENYSLNTSNPMQLLEARDLLIRQKQQGIVKAYQVDEAKDKMIQNEAAIAVVWSGDALYAIDENPDLAYSVPNEGSNIWVDCMVIPADAKNKENAETFINFMCRPDIAQKNCDYIRYSSPNSGAIELMGEEYTDNPVINPSDDVVSRCEVFTDILSYEALYTAMWSEVKNAK